MRGVAIEAGADISAFAVGIVWTGGENVGFCGVIWGVAISVAWVGTGIEVGWLGSAGVGFVTGVAVFIGSAVFVDSAGALAAAGIIAGDCGLLAICGPYGRPKINARKSNRFNDHRFPHGIDNAS